jgi:hypothetical protein
MKVLDINLKSKEDLKIVKTISVSSPDPDLLNHAEKESRYTYNEPVPYSSVVVVT